MLQRRLEAALFFDGIDGVDKVGNMKLAMGSRDGARVTLIEIRGEGGLFLCAPTLGYSLEQGSLTEIPVLTPQEREILLETAWSLNEYLPTADVPADSQFVPENRPGDDFNNRGDIRALLIKHGWTLVKKAENELWHRPGKANGRSACLKDKSFYVFSGNAAPLEPNRACISSSERCRQFGSYNKISVGN